MKEDKITVMIVDDDIRSQQVLEYHLRSIPEIEILAIASGAGEAYRFLLETVPDLIFLDVEMPGKTGFDLVGEIRKLGINPSIIFQTAFDKYALEAIKHAAFDYLLKPIDKEELLLALAKFKASNHKHQFEDQVARLIRHIDPNRKIRLNSKKGFILVDPDDIYYCRAEWNYTDVHYGDNQKATLSMNLRKVQELLPERSFFRISRSTIINMKYLTEVSRLDHTCTLHIHGKNIHFPITREHIAELEERVG